ncbi:sigma-54-dependent Fis family transcriptional regulator [bacterium]|nr:sigma-54-dependent Fis family transcriptional regulator [bacterium]
MKSVSIEKVESPQNTPSILLVDDEESVLYALEAVLKREGYLISQARSTEEALKALSNASFDLIISDVNMPGSSGLELLDKVKEKDPDILVVIITAFGSEPLAVNAMKRGAYDYLSKPFANDDLKITVRRALEKRSLRNENTLLRLRLNEREGLNSIIGSNESMQAVYDLVEKVAPNDVTVLITGESGTGKELVANAIHTLSQRKNGSFIRVNCAALPETLIESELFGYERGAFSGAVTRRIGKFELANHGTIFLDEIGDMSLMTQTKILRILQEREFERLGGTEVIRVDTRVLAATNRNLQKAIQDGKFREDLFYRLNVVSIHLPPLRERLSDVPQLVSHFAGRFRKKFKKPDQEFSEAFQSRLMQYSWPGNVRELQNLVERVIILEDESLFQVGSSQFPRKGTLENQSFVTNSLINMPYKEAKELVLRGFDRRFFEHLLERTSGNISQAAKIAGMHRKNLYMKLKELNLLRKLSKGLESAQGNEEQNETGNGNSHA